MIDHQRMVDEAIGLTREEEYLRALTIFLDAYGAEDASSPLILSKTAKSASGLSYFGLCLMLVQKKTKQAIELCKRAIELEFYDGNHYANLAPVYIAAGNREEALDTVQ